MRFLSSILQSDCFEWLLRIPWRFHNSFVMDLKEVHSSLGTHLLLILENSLLALCLLQIVEKLLTNMDPHILTWPTTQNIWNILTTILTLTLFLTLPCHSNCVSSTSVTVWPVVVEGASEQGHTISTFNLPHTSSCDLVLQSDCSSGYEKLLNVTVQGFIMQECRTADTVPDQPSPMATVPQLIDEAKPSKFSDFILLIFTLEDREEHLARFEDVLDRKLVDNIRNYLARKCLK